MKQNFGTSVWMVLHNLHYISAFGYYENQIVVVVVRKYSKPSENQQFSISNRLQETLILAQNSQNNVNFKIFWKASLLTLTNDFFGYLMSPLHHPLPLYGEGSICEEEILRYSFRTEVQPRSHRLADLWPFASKINTHLLFTVHVSNME